MSGPVSASGSASDVDAARTALRDAHAKVHFHNALAAAEFYLVLALGQHPDRLDEATMPDWLLTVAREVVEAKPAGPIPALQFIIGGGWSLAFDYRVVGGPDDGRRVSLVPLRGAITGSAATADGGRWSEANRPGFASPDPWGRDGEAPLAEVTLHACYAELVRLSEHYPPTTAQQHLRLGICQRGADPAYVPERLGPPTRAPAGWTGPGAGPVPVTDTYRGGPR